MSWWTQNAMDYYKLWVIRVWVISGLTVVKFNMHFYVRQHACIAIADE